MARRRVSNQPIRLAAGSFILNSGIEKLKAGEDRAKGLHTMASGSFPFFEKLPPEQFAKGLAVAEVALGGSLLVPLISDRMAGLALTPFAGGLLWMYANTDGMHEPGGIRPTRSGTALAKDVWLLGIGLTLLTTGGRSKRARKAKKAAAKS